MRSVRNVTDVDDDILRVARERGVDFRELATTRCAMFDHDMAEIGLLPVDVGAACDGACRGDGRLGGAGSSTAATRTRVDGWVFFNSGVYPDYGRLSRLDHATMVEAQP